MVWYYAIVEDDEELKIMEVYELGKDRDGRGYAPVKWSELSKEDLLLLLDDLKAQLSAIIKGEDLRLKTGDDDESRN